MLVILTFREGEIIISFLSAVHDEGEHEGNNL
jgi:hypothetical protein